MFQFIKANKMFTTAVAIAATLVIGVGYGLIVHNETALIVGSFMLVGAMVYGLMYLALAEPRR